MANRIRKRVLRIRQRLGWHRASGLAGKDGKSL